MAKKKANKSKAQPAKAADKPVEEPEPVEEPKPELVPEPEPEPVKAEEPVPEPEAEATPQPAAESDAAPKAVNVLGAEAPLDLAAFALCDALLEVASNPKQLEAVYKSHVSGSVPDTVMQGKPSPEQLACFQTTIGYRKASFEEFSEAVRAWEKVRAAVLAQDIDTKQLVEYLGVALSEVTFTDLVAVVQGMCADGCSSAPALVALLAQLCPTRNGPVDTSILGFKVMNAAGWGASKMSKEAIEDAIVTLVGFVRGTSSARLVSKGKFTEFITLVKQWTDEDMPDDDFFDQVAKYLPAVAVA